LRKASSDVANNATFKTSVDATRVT
jgi:hypothetical protein